MEDLKDMLGFSPSQYYYYMWKYVSPFVLLCLLVASIVQMGLSPPGYNAWIEDTVSIRCVCVYVGFVCVYDTVIIIIVIVSEAFEKHMNRQKK